MSTPESHESDAVVLVFGVLSICGLLYISAVALSGPAWMGVSFGLVELAVAWRVSPPAGGRPLRWITGVIGAFTLVWAIVWLLVS